jgi:asparagine synthase (glutamine-hydrolysing)
MCGIAGIYGLNDGEQARESVTRMMEKLVHRGPDSNGIFSADEVTLGHQRLSIIDLSADASQPFKSQDGRYTVVFNGEIYNYRELRNKLDYDFKTNSDTEVLLAAYVKWGRACCSELNGMFAFAVWDNLEKTLFLSRDRLGIKPLYFYNTNKQLVFSSELRSLLASGLVPRKMNVDGLVDYLRYQTVHCPQTIIDGVEMLPPGHYILISREELISERYWDLTKDHSKESFGQSPEEVKDQIRKKLEGAVKRRMIADVPYGAFLSGGIDSSAVVGLMSKVSANAVKTFSVTFEEEAYSEAKYARMVAEKFGTRHEEIRLRPKDFLQELPNALAAMDHPSGDGPNTFVVSKATKEAGVTMALSGLGGDELFAGYDIFKRSVALDTKKYLHSFPKIFRQFGGGVLKTLKPSVASDKIYELLKGDFLHFEYTYPISRQVLLDKEVSRLLKRDLLPGNAVFQLVDSAVGLESVGLTLSTLSKVSYAEMTTYMQNVLLRDTDQMSMAHTLEVRVPFLDHELVEYVFPISEELKYPNFPKQLLVESLGDLLPKEIVHRPKMGFTLPWDQWMRTELRSFCEERIVSFADRKEINGARIKSYWDSFLKRDGTIQWSKIWFIVVLENWLNENGVS